jgi:two-component system, OmpR family, response regulator TctD
VGCDVRILLIEDERPLAECLRKALGQSGMQVDWFPDGELGLSALHEQAYDVMVLDLGLTKTSGHAVLQALRSADNRIPVLVLTARDSLAERIGTLNEGADDFLAKPFELAELEARLSALVRRSRGGDRLKLTCGPLSFDTATRQFTLDGVRLLLPRRESALLRHLLQCKGEPTSRQRVKDAVFHDDDDVLTAAVDVLVHRLRKRLENAGVRIATYRGLGYMLEAEEAVKR